jgi:DNA-binding LytR/AlgR family response regulator
MKPIFIRQIKTPIKKIDPGTVVYLHTKQNYTTLYFSDKSSWKVRSSLFAALKKLPAGMFVRINDSTAVSIYYIDSIYRDYLVLVSKSEKPGEIKPIGRAYYKNIVEFLNVIGNT